MKIFLSTLGSDGDVLPFTHLARLLHARGHTVTVHTWSMYHAWFPAGVRLVAPAIDLSAEALHAASREALALASPWEQLGRFARAFYGLDLPPAARRAAAQAAREAALGHDAAVCDVLDHGGQLACDAAIVPWFSWASRPAPDPRDVDAPLAALDPARPRTLARRAEVPPLVPT